MGIRGAWVRGRRKDWSDPIGLGQLGFMCKSRGDMMNCKYTLMVLTQKYGIAFNKARCARTFHAGAKGRRQCHIKFKPSRTTDFECYATNTPDMSGAVIAKCRAPWGRLLVDMQRASAGILNAQGIRPGGQISGMIPGQSWAQMGRGNSPMGMGMANSQMGMGMANSPMGMGMGNQPMGMGMMPTAPMGMGYGGMGYGAMGPYGGG